MSYNTDELLAWVLGQNRRRNKDLGGWIGKPMMNPEGNVGIVVEDDNGIGRYRLLTVEFRDGHREVLTLANVGGNPAETRKWKNYFVSGETKKWVPWGW